MPTTISVIPSRTHCLTLCSIVLPTPIFSLQSNMNMVQVQFSVHIPCVHCHLPSHSIAQDSLALVSHYEMLLIGLGNHGSWNVLISLHQFQHASESLQLLLPYTHHTILFRIYDDPFYCVCDVTVVIIFIFKIVAGNESGLFFPHLVRYQTLIEAFHVTIPQNSKRFHLAHPIPFLPSYFLLAIR